MRFPGTEMILRNFMQPHNLLLHHTSMHSLALIKMIKWHDARKTNHTKSPVGNRWSMASARWKWTCVGFCATWQWQTLNHWIMDSGSIINNSGSTWSAKTRNFTEHSTSRLRPGAVHRPWYPQLLATAQASGHLPPAAHPPVFHG